MCEEEAIFSWPASTTLCLFFQSGRNLTSPPSPPPQKPTAPNRKKETHRGLSTTHTPLVTRIGLGNVPRPRLGINNWAGGLNCCRWLWHQPAAASPNWFWPQLPPVADGEGGRKLETQQLVVLASLTHFNIINHVLRKASITPSFCRDTLGHLV